MSFKVTDGVGADGLLCRGCWGCQSGARRTGTPAVCVQPAAPPLRTKGTGHTGVLPRLTGQPLVSQGSAIPGSRGGCGESWLFCHRSSARVPCTVPLCAAVTQKLWRGDRGRVFSFRRGERNLQMGKKILRLVLRREKITTLFRMKNRLISICNYFFSV